MILTAATLALLGHQASAYMIEPRQSCPGVHIFGARETTVSPGYGSAGTVVNSILSAYPGSTAEAIVYPACGGQSSCGGISYANSALQGTAAVASAVNTYNRNCPSTKLVLVGYSQGGQISENAFCGGGDTNIGLSDTSTPINAAALAQVKAVILMGDPRFTAGAPYNVGSCTAQGFAPRPAGWRCPSGDKVQSYCDARDPYCCTGSDANVHQGYGSQYGAAALAFVKSKLDASGTTPTTTAATTTRTGTTATTTTAGNSGGSCSAKWGQCGGIGWTGPTCCQSGSTCQVGNAYYSQCL
ncbi:hypothetical protein TWF481_012014 [Arthrobotrys musiformis]|uniref:CBM1 domain-containing protein n=1 Tax=Arthrobotrys musiformis TaxID=47236 RepID=A0AAV9VVS4_9PEZI